MKPDTSERVGIPARAPKFVHLRAAAKLAKIPFQIEPASRPLGNDANVIQVSRGSVAAATIGLPCRYMHTQTEVCCLKDLEQSAKLLATFIEKLNFMWVKPFVSRAVMSEDRIKLNQLGESAP